jgi:phytoene/squalene synthetase
MPIYTFENNGQCIEHIAPMGTDSVVLDGKRWMRQPVARFGVTEAAILKGEREPGFTALMEHQHARAQRYYDEARRSLPPAERGHMIAARMMDAIYSRILTQMKSTDFQTLHRRERLSKGTKAIILARFLAEGWSRRILVGQR